MPGPTTCAAIIPCYNEAASVVAVVRALHPQVARVLVVDDGSVDGTAELAQAAGATVLRHPRNFGKGAALKSGLAEARRLGFAWAITLDGDGQHAPDDVPVFFRCATGTGALLVMGDRMQDAPAIPWLRRRVNRWMSRRLSARAGRCLPDTQCGFRLIHLAAWARLPLRTEHFEVESETLMAFLDAGYPIAFVPIRTIGRGPDSHIRPLADAWRWWRWWRSSRQSTVRATPSGAAPASR